MSSQVLLREDRLSAPLPQRRTLQLCRPVAVDSKASQPVEDIRPVGALTTQDYINVMLATIREGFRHERWPKDVVASFLAAEVIAPGRGDNLAGNTLQIPHSTRPKIPPFIFRPPPG